MPEPRRVLFPPSFELFGYDVLIDERCKTRVGWVANRAARQTRCFRFFRKDVCVRLLYNVCSWLLHVPRRGARKTAVWRFLSMEVGNLNRRAALLPWRATLSCLAQGRPLPGRHRNRRISCIESFGHTRNVSLSRTLAIELAFFISSASICPLQIHFCVRLSSARVYLICIAPRNVSIWTSGQAEAVAD